LDFADFAGCAGMTERVYDPGLRAKHGLAAGGKPLEPLLRGWKRQVRGWRMGQEELGFGLPVPLLENGAEALDGRAQGGDEHG
jgi:hypothetical protein